MIKDSLASKPGTHPSFASSLAVVECDRCGAEFRADTRVSGDWMLHGEHVGITDQSSGDDVDLCSQCEHAIFAED